MLLLNLGLATFGLIGSLAAFGGETWKQGSAPILSRVTRRGWIALGCLLLAFALGGLKEVLHYQAGKLDALEKASLQKRNEDQIAQIATLQKNLEGATQRLGEQQLGSIEAAFKLAIGSPRETDDAVVHLEGQPVAAIPSRHYPSMQLYWGDSFSFTVVYDPNQVPVAHLATLRLRVGGREYPLHDGVRPGLFENAVRIYGDSPKPMQPQILNPLRLKRVELKIFIKTTDSSQGQQEFRKLVLNSPFSEFAKRMYKATTGDIVNVRANPESGAFVRSQLTRGSLVRVLQTQGNWSEILTPEGRQGWMLTSFLGDIK